MTRIIAIANSKGGVTKSTSVVNLCAIAGQLGEKALLIDADPQGSATALSGITDFEFDCADLFGDTPRNPSEIAIASPYGFDVIPAGSRLMNVADWLHTKHLSETRLRTLLQRDEQLSKYDYVFFDLAGDKHKFNTTVLFAADEVVIPVTPTKFSSNELVNFLDYIGGINSHREAFNMEIIKIRSIFFNRVKGYQVASKANLQEVTEGLSEFASTYPVATSYIPETTAVEKAEAAFKPVVCEFPNHKVTTHFHMLFTEMFSQEGTWRGETH